MCAPLLIQASALQLAQNVVEYNKTTSNWRAWSYPMFIDNNDEAIFGAFFDSLDRLVQVRRQAPCRLGRRACICCCRCRCPFLANWTHRTPRPALPCCPAHPNLPCPPVTLYRPAH